jgi:hypothetical protein
MGHAQLTDGESAGELNSMVNEWHNQAPGEFKNDLIAELT